VNRCASFQRKLAAAKVRAQARADRLQAPCHVFRGSAGFQILTDAEAEDAGYLAHEALCTLGPNGVRLFLRTR
jgi:hypothetical protein